MTTSGPAGTIAETEPLLPSSHEHHESMAQAVSVTMIPFYSFFIWVWNVFTFKSFRNIDAIKEEEQEARMKSTPYGHRKHKPRIAGGGQNLPLEVIRALSEWLATIDARGTGGSQLGAMVGCLQSFESSLTDLERLLTTPLPV